MVPSTRRPVSDSVHKPILASQRDPQVARDIDSILSRFTTIQRIATDTAISTFRQKALADLESLLARATRHRDILAHHAAIRHIQGIHVSSTRLAKTVTEAAPPP